MQLNLGNPSLKHKASEFFFILLFGVEMRVGEKMEETVGV
jgi:hypothetical protein